MSISIHYCFNYSKDLAHLAEDINACLGCHLAPYDNDPDDWFDRFLGMEFSLYPLVGYENDRELDFENFKYGLDFKTSRPDTDLRSIQFPAMMMVIYRLHQRYGIVGIVVYDLQILIARYEQREASGYGKRLYDTVSGTLFTDFLGHLNVLKKRLPNSR